MKQYRIALLALIGAIAVGGGCTSLGPMAGMTMANVSPQHRAGAELQVAAVPGYYLSDAVKADENGTAHDQYAVFLDPGRYLGAAEGLSVGLRWVGRDDGFLEPMIRYRRALDDDERVSLGVIGYGTYAEGEERGASYSATRAGAEVAVDVRATPKNRWAELHLTGGASLTGIFATGSYCKNDETGYGRDCDDGERGATAVDVSGAYPSAFAGLSVDLFRDVPVLHGLRLGAYVAGGSMPGVRDGEQGSYQAWFMGGLAITVGIGEQ